MELPEVISDIADVLIAIDSLLRLIRDRLNSLDAYRGIAVTKRTPDLLLDGQWALEFKIVRPFGDNGKVAENWSVNLLHPYEGNVSAIGDCFKLLSLDCPERRAAVVIGYEHSPPQLSLDPLLAAFELVARNVAKIRVLR